MNFQNPENRGFLSRGTQSAWKLPPKGCRLTASWVNIKIFINIFKYFLNWSPERPGRANVSLKRAPQIGHCWRILEQSSANMLSAKTGFGIGRMAGNPTCLSRVDGLFVSHSSVFYLPQSLTPPLSLGCFSFNENSSYHWMKCFIQWELQFSFNEKAPVLSYISFNENWSRLVSESDTNDGYGGIRFCSRCASSSILSSAWQEIALEPCRP